MRANPAYGGPIDFPLHQRLTAPLTDIYTLLSDEERLAVTARFVEAYGRDYLDVSPEQLREWIAVARSFPYKGLPRVRSELSPGEVVARLYRKSIESELLASARRRKGRERGLMEQLRSEHGARVRRIAQMLSSERASAYDLYVLQAEIMGMEPLENLSSTADVVEEQRRVLRQLAPIVDPVWLPAWRSGKFSRFSALARALFLGKHLSPPAMMFLLVQFGRAFFLDAVPFDLRAALAEHFRLMSEWAAAGMPGEPPYRESLRVAYVFLGDVFAQRDVRLFNDATRAILSGDSFRSQQEVAQFIGVRALGSDAERHALMIQLFPAPSLVDL